MRGVDSKQSAMFSYGSPEDRIPKNQPLRSMRAIVSDALTQPIRAGEEFATLLPETPYASALEIARRLRESSQGFPSSSRIAAYRSPRASDFVV